MATQQDLRKRPLQSKGPEAEPDWGGSNVTANVSSIDIATGEPWRNVASGPWRLSLPLLLIFIAIYMFCHRRGVPAAVDIARDEHRVERPDGAVGVARVGRGGFHGKAIPLYLAQLGLSLSWNPITFTVGMNLLGSAVMVGWLRSFFGCYKTSRKVNPSLAIL